MKQFVILQKIGEGAYSNVHRVKRISDGEVYALKSVKVGELNEREKQNALNEIRILASIEDPTIIGYKEAFFDEPSNSLCIVMQLASKGDLSERIKEQIAKRQLIPEAEVRKMMEHVARGLNLLHSMKILHRDIKPANVFLSETSDYQLGDMNVSKVAKRGLVYTQTGTPYYASPEIWRDEPYGEKSDIWSYGCVAYEMASLKAPFRAQNMELLFKKVQRGACERIPSLYSVELAQLIQGCLRPDPKQRPTALQVLQQLAKPGPPSNFNQAGQSNMLLETIRIPFNMKQVKLPGQRYTRSYMDTSNENKRRVQLPLLNQYRQPTLHFSMPANNISRLSNPIGYNDPQPPRRHGQTNQERILPVIEQHQRYINSSSSQIQNMYLNPPNPIQPRQKPSEKPLWWG